ncbi:MAG: hypothetical protein IIA30_14925 [Myxococcales bacterium]|nr:hypothetical protein [Myxococcales bacterium]
MKLFRPMVIVLAWTFSVLLIAQTAAAAGKGGQGPGAAVAIDIIRLTDLQGGKILAEISGGGFLGGPNGARSVEVILDDVTSLHITVHSADLLSATIPKGTPDGDHIVTVRVGLENKQSASAMISLGGEMIVSCISWFVSGPADEHVHTEVHVEDENGVPVIGATVTWEAENPSGDVYQTNVSPTHDNDGHAAGENCANPVSGSGVTDWFCCIGAGKWDGEIPGKRACDEGLYTSRILDVAAPPQTNMVWNEKASELEATITLDPIPQ